MPISFIFEDCHQTQTSQASVYYVAYILEIKVNALIIRIGELYNEKIMKMTINAASSISFWLSLQALLDYKFPWLELP